MTDRVKQDVVEISDAEYYAITKQLDNSGIKPKMLTKSVHIPLPRLNIHIGKNFSCCYQYSTAYDENHQEIGKSLIIIQNEVDNWGLIYSINSNAINVFKHTLGEHKNIPSALKKASKERQNAITAFFVIQFYLKRLPEVWVKTQEKRELTKKEIDEKKKNGKKRVKKVQLINHYKFDLEELEKKNKKGEMTRVFLCPCWGVRGHYRHLKNDKVIWIRSYRKGVRRNEENIYEAKTYVA